MKPPQGSTDKAADRGCRVSSCSHLSVVPVCGCGAPILPGQGRMLFRDGSVLCRSCARSFRAVKGLKEHADLRLVDPAVFKQLADDSELGAIGDQRRALEIEPRLPVVQADLVFKIVPVVVGLLAGYCAWICIHNLFANSVLVQ